MHTYIYMHTSTITTYPGRIFPQKLQETMDAPSTAKGHLGESQTFLTLRTTITSLKGQKDKTNNVNDGKSQTFLTLRTTITSLKGQKDKTNNVNDGKSQTFLTLRTTITSLKGQKDKTNNVNETWILQKV